MVCLRNICINTLHKGDNDDDDDDDNDDNNNNNNNNNRKQIQTLPKFDETIDHIISTCPILAKEQYTKRHDRVFAQLHFNICKETGVQLDK